MEVSDCRRARRFLRAAERAERADHSVRTICVTLAYASCRLSEALALTADRVDLANGTLVFEGRFAPLSH